MKAGACLVEGFQKAVSLHGPLGIFTLIEAHITPVFFHINKNEVLLGPISWGSPGVNLIQAGLDPGLSCCCQGPSSPFDGQPKTP